MQTQLDVKIMKHTDDNEDKETSAIIVTFT